MQLQLYSAGWILLQTNVIIILPSQWQVELRILLFVIYAASIISHGYNSFHIYSIKLSTSNAIVE